MDIKFKDKWLEKIESGSANELAHEVRLPLAVIKSAQKKLQFLRATTDEKTLLNWKSLHYEKLKGDMEGLSSIRLNDQWRMVLSVEAAVDGLSAVIVSIDDYH